MKHLHKFTTDDGNESREYRFPNLWCREKTNNGSRLVFGPRASSLDLILEVCDVLDGPFLLLYVLIVPRRGLRESGRYQNGCEFTHTEFANFIESYRKYFEQDGRHNLWIRCDKTGSHLIFDRHGRIYFYGNEEIVLPLLYEKGFVEKDIQISFGHSHHYHQEFDDDEERLMAAFDWQHFPLQDIDET